MTGGGGEDLRVDKRVRKSCVANPETREDGFFVTVGSHGEGPGSRFVFI